MVQRLVTRHPWRHSPRPHQYQRHLNACTAMGTMPTSSRTDLRFFATTLISVAPAARPISRSSRVLLTGSLVQAHRYPGKNYPQIRFRLLSTLGDTPISPLRKNMVDVQMLHPELHQKVFPPSSVCTQKTSAGAVLASSMEPTPDMVRCSISHLEKQDLWGKEAILVPDTTFQVPSLRGQNIEDHFYNIGVHDSATYKDMAVTFAQSPVHAPPKQWVMQAGWTRYGRDGSISQIEYPKEQMLTFDVETVPALSKYPIMACAMSSDAWYGWVSPWLINPVTKDGEHNDHHLISLGPSRNRKGEEKVIVGHNVGYDRARVLEEYCLEQNGIRYLDTMSLHIAVSGLCTQQRPSWLKYSKAVENENSEYLHACKDTTGKYFDVSSINSLLQVSKFHCGIQMDKAPRNILMEARDIGLVQEHFQELMTYCGQDVAATHAVYQKILPKFFETCPHPVSFAGILQMGSSFLTVNEGWTAYIDRCSKTYNEMAQTVESKLLALADKAMENFEKDPQFYESDPWLSQLDWTLPERRWKEGKPRANGKGWLKGQEPRWVCQTKLLPDKPAWYRALWDPKDQRIKVTIRQRAAPLLMRLQWRGYPLVHSKLFGWTFKVPKEDQDFVTKATELTFPLENEAGYQPSIDSNRFRYYQVPHKAGDGMNVGNPLAKGYVGYFEDNILSSYVPEGGSVKDGSSTLAKQALDMNAQCAYWVSARERIMDQFVVWDKDANKLSDRMGLPDRGEGRLNGMILPQIITMGTVTRRAVEKTWMTASNAKKNRIGSELKSMVQAPAGYKIVGADVDSEELWISSLMGDAQFRMHGATALGWMTLQGTKAAGTDLHSKTAQILGISRDQAKVFNYGRIYGAGVKFAARLLQQFNSTIEAAEAKQRAGNLYTATKGTKQQKPVDYELVTDRPFWHGGTESYMFNSLERTATADDPRTPALGCGITDALKPKHTENQFMTSRVNWVVQSSGVDYLHMLLVSMNYLIKKYDIKARFMLCVHDEVRYIVKEEDTARATLALQISNLWTRALFSYKLGIHDLPQSVAFFSAVDIDHVFRKEVNMDCLTPTQKVPIPHGESLTIEGVLDLTQGGSLGEIVEGFVDASDVPFPLELRSKEELRKLQANQERKSETDQSLTQSLSQDEDQAQEFFLEAQGMSTMSEIKKTLKQRKTEAEKALLEKLKAKRAASGANGDNEGEGSKGLRSTSTRRKKDGEEGAPKPRTVMQLMRPRLPGMRNTSEGKWGMTMMEEPAAFQDTTASDEHNTTVDIIPDTPMPYKTVEITKPLVTVEATEGTVVFTPDKDVIETGAQEPLMKDPASDLPKAEEQEDLFRSSVHSFTQSVENEVNDPASDNNWALPAEKWLQYIAKDYKAPGGPAVSMESHHMAYVLPSAEQIYTNPTELAEKMPPRSSTGNPKRITSTNSRLRQSEIQRMTAQRNAHASKVDMLAAASGMWHKHASSSMRSGYSITKIIRASDLKAGTSSTGTSSSSSSSSSYRHAEGARTRTI